jgi:hypothetical protein
MCEGCARPYDAAFEGAKQNPPCREKLLTKRALRVPELVAESGLVVGGERASFALRKS